MGSGHDRCSVDAFIAGAAARMADAPALAVGDTGLSYAALDALVTQVAAALQADGLPAGARVAVYLPKTIACIASLFGAARAGGVFVPINPVLKAPQVRYILEHSGAHVLITSALRWQALAEAGLRADGFDRVVCADAPGADRPATVTAWEDWLAHAPASAALPQVGHDDLAALMYTSGSTGQPKGVMLSHANLRYGALSVAHYLRLCAADRLLAVLPLSFDYGLNQVISAALVGAQVVLLDDLFPRQVISALQRHAITGLAGVPPLWSQLAQLAWPDEVRTSLRYITNSGGHMPQPILERLCEALPKTQVYLMYGLTEAFRSTYLPPAMVAAKPASIGQAIPFADVHVLRPDGTLTADDEPGELVHSGPLVAQGYWRDSEKTARRFRPAPAVARWPGTPAVWSGDTLVRDADGDLRFVGRDDEMIKTSGYRVSPSEVEAAALATGLVAEAVAFGVQDERLGQVVGLVATGSGAKDSDGLRAALQAHIPAYMIPVHILWQDALPRNPNGKLDRTGIIGAARAVVA